MVGRDVHDEPRVLLQPRGFVWSAGCRACNDCRVTRPAELWC
jgi:hypothetical protein